MTKYDQIKNIAALIHRGETYYKGIALPTPQLSGTSYQQTSYANQVARKFYTQHFE